VSGKGMALAFGLLGVGVWVAASSGAGGDVKRQLGRFFSWAELTASSAARRLGIDNTPPPEAQVAMRHLVANVLDPLRTALGRPVRVTSGYRAPAVNQAVSGSTTSQHMRGEAVDIKVDGVSAEALASAIVALGLPFDQVIWYAPERGGHVHVSFTVARENRRQTLYAKAGGGYLAWRPTRRVA